MDISKLTAIGGKEWRSQDGKLHRVYVPVATLLKFECSHYGTGNISGATIAGREISNAMAREYDGFCSDSKAWVDVNTGKFGVKLGYSRRLDVTAETLENALRELMGEAHV